MPQPIAHQSVRIVSDEGSGRPFIVIYEQSAYAELSTQVALELAKHTRVLVLSTDTVTHDNWALLSDELLALVRANGMRQVSCIALGSVAAIVQNLCLQELKVVRTLVLVDAASRAHPTRYSRFIDSLEKLLPLGLPFRHRDRGFDSKPYVQRIRCPVLVVTTDAASEHIRREAELLEQRLPTSWRFEISGPKQAGMLAAAVVEFQDVPARCPQKNLSKERAVQSA